MREELQRGTEREVLKKRAKDKTDMCLSINWQFTDSVEKSTTDALQALHQAAQYEPQHKSDSCRFTHTQNINGILSQITLFFSFPTLLMICKQMYPQRIFFQGTDF